MAAVATQTSSERVVSYPTVSNETLELMRQQQRELLSQPERMEPPAELFRRERFIFRARHGLSQITHTLDLKPEVDDPSDMRQKFRLARWEHRHRGDKDAARKIADLADRLGGAALTFTRVKGRKECYFATNDPVIAAYLRDLVKRAVGDFADVWEESGTARIIVGDKAFPNTPLGWQMARDHQAASGATELRIVNEADEAEASA